MKFKIFIALILFIAQPANISKADLASVPPEKELEIAQQFLENVKTFIKLYPDEFDTIKVFEFILITRPIMDGNLDDKLKEDLKLFVEFTNKSNQFVKYKDEIEKNIGQGLSHKKAVAAVKKEVVKKEEKKEVVKKEEKKEVVKKEEKKEEKIKLFNCYSNETKDIYLENSITIDKSNMIIDRYVNIKKTGKHYKSIKIKSINGPLVISELYQTNLKEYKWQLEIDTSKAIVFLKRYYTHNNKLDREHEPYNCKKEIVEIN